jgi:hypothetical protein
MLPSKPSHVSRISANIPFGILPFSRLSARPNNVSEVSAEIDCGMVPVN